MKTIKITVENEEAARSLIGIVKELNFVTSIESVEDINLIEVPKGAFFSEAEFLGMCGIWKDRELSAEKIREQAWKKIKL